MTPTERTGPAGPPEDGSGGYAPLGGRGAGDHRGADVLVACADDDARQIVVAMLRHEGWRVFAAEPTAAVAAARTSRPLLVVTSYPADTGDGRTLTEVLRTSPHTAHLPILSVTSRAFAADLALAEGAGVTASLVMPVLPARVAEEVRRLLGPEGAELLARRVAGRQAPAARPAQHGSAADPTADVG